MRTAGIAILALLMSLTVGFGDFSHSTLAPVTGASDDLTRVIGRTQDLRTPGVVRSGESPLDFHVVRRVDGSIDTRATWSNNDTALRTAMREQRPIRDVSPGDTGGLFLNAERLQLEHRGWTPQVIDGDTFWMPPVP